MLLTTKSCQTMTKHIYNSSFSQFFHTWSRCDSQHIAKRSIHYLMKSTVQSNMLAHTPLATGAPENFLASQAWISEICEIIFHFRNCKLKVCRSNGSKNTCDCHFGHLLNPTHYSKLFLCTVRALDMLKNSDMCQSTKLF